MMEKLELHYYLTDGVHSMDAFVKNKSEAELLKVFKEISDILELDLTFEIEALDEGGIKEYFKVLKNKKSRKKAIRLLSSVGLIFSGVIINVVSNNLTKNNELEKSQLEESQLNIRKLKKELENDNISEEKSKIIIQKITIFISNSEKIKFHRSNFYSHLLNESKLEKISTTELDENYNSISEEKIVKREDFKENIIEKIKIDSEYIENANIEITSPVFGKSKIKWRGNYDSKPISFNLKDSSFKNSVVNREISFKNGTSIKCQLELEKEIDNEGNIKTTNINVYDIIKVFEGEKMTITKKGKEIEDQKNQIKISFID